MHVGQEQYTTYSDSTVAQLSKKKEVQAVQQ